MLCLLRFRQSVRNREHTCFRRTRNDGRKTDISNYSKNAQSNTQRKLTNIMTKKHVLITGGAGFIGANFVEYLIEKEQENLVVLDKLTYAGNKDNLKLVADKITFIHGDICDDQLVKELFEKYQFEQVVHFAAESHVDNSISDPGAFIQTNIVGTFNLLNTAYHTWMSGPNASKEYFKNARFLHVSTDEVYGTLGKTGLFTEQTPYAPNSPYSASKAASDFIVRSYFHTYGMPVVITNCSNNYGAYQ